MDLPIFKIKPKQMKTVAIKVSTSVSLPLAVQLRTCNVSLNLLRT